MKCCRSYLYLFVLLLCVGSPWSWATERTVRVLTVGNSFARNAAHFLEEIAASQEVTMVIGRANLSGASMERHARHLAAAQSGAESEEGRPYWLGPDQPRTSLPEMLRREAWDFVTIQQVSVQSSNAASFEPFAGQLVDAIRTNAPQADILVHQIWAYRADDPWFTGEHEADAEGETLPTSQAEMYRRLRSNYDALADRYGLRQIPVGDAFQHARALKPWVFWWPDPRFDYVNPAPGTLPEQPGSLNVGWQWKPDRATGAQRLSLDAHHANLAGCYLAGLVWFEVLTGQAPAADVWHPAELDDQQVFVLMRAAHAAVRARR